MEIIGLCTGAGRGRSGGEGGRKEETVWRMGGRANDLSP
jgi:hypothetical protein